MDHLKYLLDPDTLFRKSAIEYMKKFSQHLIDSTIAFKVVTLYANVVTKVWEEMILGTYVFNLRKENYVAFEDGF
jgi:hypothetical protein